MRVLVTGADGFVGSHVVRAALAAGHDVEAVHRRAPAHPHAGVTATWSGDLTTTWPAGDVPDAVIHLASLAAVGASFGRPQEFISANTAMMTTLGEALLAADARTTRVVVVSTGALYRSDDGPCDEDRPLSLTSPYAVSKAAVELQCDYYRARGLDVVVARPFNHIGPGQARGFLVPDLAADLLSLPPGAPIVAGNLDTRRDYTDVRDVAQAYLALIGAPDPRPVYNIASGASRSGREILAALADAIGRDVPLTETDAARLRPNDPPEIIGDASRLRADAGWSPSIPFEQSITDFVRGLAPRA